MRKYSLTIATALVALALTSVPAVARVFEMVADISDWRFTNRNDIGDYSTAALIAGSDGNYYGTSYFGGLQNEGSVYKMTPGGDLTTLVEFGDETGRNPDAPLVEGSDGNFYGSTFLGGGNNCGTIFRITPGGDLSTLVEFTGNGSLNKGDRPRGLVEGAGGLLYGTTMFGGEHGKGTIFHLTHAGELTTLVQFTGVGGTHRGARVYEGLTLGNDGNFYGTTWAGGPSDCGTVYKMTPEGTLTTLIDFTGDGSENQGARPDSTLLLGSNGNFYGTTDAGGVGFVSGQPHTGNGTIFKMTPAGVLTTMAAFAGSSASRPVSIVEGVGGDEGIFYGTTMWGGAFGQGSFFSLTPEGTLTTLLEFSTGSTLPTFTTHLVSGLDGDLYGTSRDGIFKISLSEGLTELVEFAGFGWMGIGVTSVSALEEDGAGNLYGLTQNGGRDDLGAIFKLTPADQLTSLLSFAGDGPSNKGANPVAGMRYDGSGNFYGTTRGGGALDKGSLFKMTSAGVLTTLVEFTGNGTSNRGAYPSAAMILASDGNLYGTTEEGGAFDNGTVFKMTPAGMLTTLIEFTGQGVVNRGGHPSAAVVEARDGNFYGTTGEGGLTDLGTIFKITPAGELTTLVEFTGDGASNKGAYPSAAVIEASDGNFYGTTEYGGADDYGTLFKMTPAGMLTTLVEFTRDGTSVGAQPIAALVEARDGNIYGTTSRGAAGDLGTIFEITPPSVFTTIYQFGNYYYDNEDGRPNAGLTLASDGDLYGTTMGSTPGSTSGGFNIFRLHFNGPPGVFGISAAVKGTGMRISGSVNPANRDTSAVFHWGTDDGDLSNIVPTPPAMMNGSSNVPVIFDVSDLESGRRYYYKLVATNDAGSTESWVGGFTMPTSLQLWRLEHFNTMSNSGSAADDADPDGDGSDNMNEFLAGTDPNDPDDNLRISSFGIEEAGFVVSAEGKVGRVYLLERSMDPAGNSWNTIASTAPLVADSLVTFTDPSPLPSSALYRIGVFKP